MLNYLLISSILLMAGLGFPGGNSVQVGEPQPGLAASLSSSASAIAPGEAAHLTLFLVPGQGQTVEIEGLRPADSSAWALAEGPQLPLAVQAPAAVQLTLIPQKTGRLRPVILVDYRLDGQAGQLLVEGEWLGVTAPPQKTTPIPWSSLLTYLAGAASAIVASLVIENYKNQRQRALNRERTFGLLRLVIVQARAAVEHGEPLDLAPLQTIYQAEGLYTALSEAGLHEPARDVWIQAAEHNRFVGRRQGWQHETALAAAVNILENRLKEPEAALGRQRQGWLARLKAWLKRGR